MRKTVWTEGPWRRDKFEIIGDDNSVVARVIPWDGSGCREEDNANAKLLAASTDMIDALLAILPFIPASSVADGGASRYSKNVIAADMVRAAIKKALEG